MAKKKRAKDTCKKNTPYTSCSAVSTQPKFWSITEGSSHYHSVLSTLTCSIVFFFLLFFQMLGNQRWLCIIEQNGSVFCFSTLSESLISVYNFFFYCYYLPLTPFDIWDQMNSNEPKIGLESISMQSKSRVNTSEQTTSVLHAGFSASPPASFPKARKETYVVQPSGIVSRNC